MQRVESVRNKGKVRQKIIKHLGVSYDQKQLDDLKSLAQILKEKLETTPQFSLFVADDLPVETFARVDARSSLITFINIILKLF